LLLLGNSQFRCLLYGLLGFDSELIEVHVVSWFCCSLNVV
jgi:hypothetical protein